MKLNPGGTAPGGNKASAGNAISTVGSAGTHSVGSANGAARTSESVRNWPASRSVLRVYLGSGGPTGLRLRRTTAAPGTEFGTEFGAAFGTLFPKALAVALSAGRGAGRCSWCGRGFRNNANTAAAANPPAMAHRQPLRLGRAIVAAPEKLVQNGVRRGPVPDTFGGARRKVSAS
jgi:hypothetical protein